MHTRPSRRLVALTIATFIAAPTSLAEACTRAVYFGKEDQTVTGRTMDWAEDLHSDLWLFPRGMQRDGGMGDSGFKWTSRHGSVIASAYDGATVDGMNEQGLVANLLYLAEAEYPPPKGDARPQMCVTAWAQYVLDRFSTVAEAVADARKEAFRVVGVTAPNGKPGSVHLAISDPTGDSAILEFIGGKLVVHHGRQYQVMTNSPPFDDQLALDAYWKQIGGTTMLPGTNRAADRFARASFYINACEQSADPREAVAAVFSVMRNVSVPRGISTPDQPNIASTLWRTVADQKTRTYYFESTFSPSLVWVRLDDLDFGAADGPRQLDLSGNPDLAGNQSAGFTKAAPFTFLAPQ
jgi:choloylglycine hydrolase